MLDPAKAAALKHFSDLLEGLFDSEDQFTSDGESILEFSSMLWWAYVYTLCHIMLSSAVK